MNNHKISTMGLKPKVLLIQLAYLTAFAGFCLLLSFHANAQDEQQEIVVYGRRTSRYSKALNNVKAELSLAKTQLQSAITKNMSEIKSARKTKPYKKCLRSNAECLEALGRIASRLETTAFMTPGYSLDTYILKDHDAERLMSSPEKEQLKFAEQTRGELYAQPFGHMNVQSKARIQRCLSEFYKIRDADIDVRNAEMEASREKSDMFSLDVDKFVYQFNLHQVMNFRCYHLEEEFLRRPELATGAQISDFLSRTETANAADLRRLRQIQL